ncbi:hypothetical protein BDZ45DRAFT_746359 [Acephala macrosclerotiorum]|nr:hypothetical protein BDZ45DRAFT_746359 [Acephala macrosclerotiorum]
MGIAIALVATIIVTLAHFDGQVVRDWPLHINLSTLIAVLSTVLRATMMVVVAEVIGQLKWSWFSRPWPLNHLQHFDDASQGVIGSSRLPFAAPTSILAVLAAFITILSLAIGPFTQQAIKSVNCPQYVADANASLPVSHLRPGRAAWNGSGNDSTTQASCSTGTCTFPAYSDNITHLTIGICRACIDTTSPVTFRVFEAGIQNTQNEYILMNVTNFSLPLDPNTDLWATTAPPQTNYIDAATGSLDWANFSFTPGFIAVAKHGLTNFTILALTQSPCTNPPGTPNYHAEVQKGVLKERVVSTAPATINYIEANISESTRFPPDNANYTALKRPCVINGTELTATNNFSDVPRILGRELVSINWEGKNVSAPNECLYKIRYQFPLNSFFISLFTGTCTYFSTQDQVVYCGDSWWLPPL